MTPDIDFLDRSLLDGRTVCNDTATIFLRDSMKDMVQAAQADLQICAIGQKKLHRYIGLKRFDRHPTNGGCDPR